MQTSPEYHSSFEPASLSLKALTALTRLLPPIRGAARVAFTYVRPLYRGSGHRVLPIWDGVRMSVDPNDYLGGYLAFLPQVYDRWERKAIAAILRPGDTFVDIGSNIGAYTLWAAHCVGSSGRVFAMEADWDNHGLLSANIRLNGFEDRVTALHCGISDRREALHLHRNISGNCGGHNFGGRGSEGAVVNCVPLAEALTTASNGPIRMMKLDIEGFEHRALKQYFRDAPAAAFPEYLLVEIEGGPTSVVQKTALRNLIFSHGYRAARESDNTLFRRKGAGE